MPFPVPPLVPFPPVVGGDTSTLADIWTKIRDKYLPGTIHTAKVVAKDPFQAVVPPAAKFIDAVGTLLSNAVQDLPITPTPVIGASQPFIPIQKPGDFLLRLNRLVSGVAAPVGLSPTAWENEAASLPAPKNFSEQVTRDWTVATNQIGGAINPFPHLERLLSGKSEAGFPITASEAGEEALSAVGKSLIAAAPIGKTIGAMDTATMGLETAAKAKKLIMPNTAVKEAMKESGIEIPKPVSVLKEPSPLDIVDSLNAQYSVPEFNAVLRDLASKEVTRQIFESRYTGKPGGLMAHEIAMEAVRQGTLDPETIISLGRYHSQPIEQVVSNIANTIDLTARVGGKTEKLLSDFIKELKTDLEYRAYQLKDPKAIEALKAQKEAARIKFDLSDPQVVWNYIAQETRFIEHIRRGLGVSPIPTAMRNYVSQGMQFALSAVEDAMSTGVAGFLKGKTFTKSVSDAMADGLESFYIGMNRYSRPTSDAIYQQARKIIDLFPALREDMVGVRDYGSLETGGRVVSDILKGKLGEGAEALVNGANFLNRWQEREWRTINFASRLWKNLKDQGITEMSAYREELVKQWAAKHMGVQDALNQFHHQALADAWDYAMKQTFSYTPTKAGGPANFISAHILDAFKAIPFSTAVVTPFPRFMINTWRWITEHNPLNLMEMFSPEVRRLITSDNPSEVFKSREARDMLGKAMSGTMLLSAAWALRNSELAGPKYWQVDARLLGDNPTHKDSTMRDFADIRPYSPILDKFLYIADMIRRHAEGRETGLALNEHIDAVSGVRRLSDVPLFSFQIGLEDMMSDDPQRQNLYWKKQFGNWAAMFTRPFSQIDTILGLANEITPGADKKSLNPYERSYAYAKSGLEGVNKALRIGMTPDLKGQEFLGPVQQNLPGKPGLPEKTDIFTSKPRRFQSPLRQMAGVSISPIHPLQALAENTGMTITQFIPDYGSAAANDLIAKKLGTILSLKGSNNETIADVITKTIHKLGNKSTPLTNDKLREYGISETIQSIRDIAYDLANQEKPELFVEYKLKHKQLGPFKQDIINQLRTTVNAR